TPCATETLCQVFPKSNERSSVPLADMVHCGAANFARCGEWLTTAFCSTISDWVMVRPFTGSGAGVEASTFAVTASPLPSTVSAELPGSSLTPTVAGLLSSTATFVTSLDLNPGASALTEYAPGNNAVKTKFPC